MMRPKSLLFHFSSRACDDETDCFDELRVPRTEVGSLPLEMGVEKRYALCSRQSLPQQSSVGNKFCINLKFPAKILPWK